MLTAFIAGIQPAASAETLKKLAAVGPWPSLSAATVFEGRLWFVNSVKGRNHNSADLYSFDPRDSKITYERHLFSQDAGDPAIHAGHLYWPMEDYRFSLGWGAFAATRSGRWSNGSIPGVQIFHTHAMASNGARLYAATSGWTAKLNVSDDNGTTWRQIYEHPTPKGVVSRITSLTPLGGKLIAQLIVRGVPALTTFADGQLRAIEGWPRGVSMLGNAVLGKHVYAVLNRAEDGSQLWATDGTDASPLPIGGINGTLTDVAEDGKSLWALVSSGDGGSVWQRGPDGIWDERYRFTGGYPRELLIETGAVFIVGDGIDGQGILWGLPQSSLTVPDAPAASTPVQTSAADAKTDWPAIGEELDGLLAAPERYRARKDNLRDVVHRIARSGPPAGFFSKRINARLPQSQISLIGGQVKVPASTYARWVLLWGMGLAREPQVPLALVSEPWRSPPNGAEKYFDPAPGALWAAREAGQKDNATIQALVDRLGDTTDPKWLSVHVAATLRELTGQPFGNSHTEWSDWWGRNRNNWDAD